MQKNKFSCHVLCEKRTLHASEQSPQLANGTDTVQATTGIKTIPTYPADMMAQVQKVALLNVMLFCSRECGVLPYLYF